MYNNHQYLEQHIFRTGVWDGSVNDLEYRLVRVNGFSRSEALAVRHGWMVQG